MKKISSLKNRTYELFNGAHYFATPLNNYSTSNVIIL